MQQCLRLQLLPWLKLHIHFPSLESTAGKHLSCVLRLMEPFKPVNLELLFGHTPDERCY